jgi:filamentous hemagglutinin family protein
MQNSPYGKFRLDYIKLTAIITALLMVFFNTSVLAAGLPAGGKVTGGSGTISQSGNDMTINQSTNKLALDWQSYSVGPQNSVTYNQPSAASVALNRVLGSDASVIQGAIKANGQVFLINPNGVLFSSSARVDVGGIVASTLDLTTENFMAGDYTFKGDSSNAVINQGNIKAGPGGTIAFLAAKIINTGSLSTGDRGNVLLGAGSRIVLDLGGPVKLEVEEAALDALIEQGGAIKADGGFVFLTAKAAGDLASTVINHTGITEAKTLETGENGQIVLLGDMENDLILVGGTLDASSPEGLEGGFIETSAAEVKIASGTKVQAGHWLIDPTDITIDAAMAATLETQLGTGNATVTTAGAGTDAGDIHVNSDISWSANLFTLTADNDININADLTATGTGILAMNMGGEINNPFDANGNFKGRVDLSGAAAGTVAINATNYTIIKDRTGLENISLALGGNYVQGTNLDLTVGGNWTPLGDAGTNFTGNYNGLGNTIANLNINLPGTNYVGLFGETNGSDIRNVGITSGSVIGNIYVGGLAGLVQGWVQRSYITNSYSAVTVTGSDRWTGGLVGFVHSTDIANSYATGAVSGTIYIGGFMGESRDSTITDSYATGIVAGTGYRIGGFAALVDDTSIINSYATGAVTGDTYVGGFVGISYDTTTITNSYATGNVAGVDYVGGFVGYIDTASTITNTYATGNVAGVDYVGGLAGYLKNNPTINDSYATGAVSGTNFVGGLVGESVTSTVTNSFWDVETSGLGTADSTADSDGGTGKTTEQLKTLQTFIDAGWDIQEDNTLAADNYPKIRTLGASSAWGFGTYVAPPDPDPTPDFDPTTDLKIQIAIAMAQLMTAENIPKGWSPELDIDASPKPLINIQAEEPYTR